MAEGLRKQGSGPYSIPGAYRASGTLRGIDGPGRRTVSALTLQKLGAGEDLAVLSHFPDLVQLELEHATDLDLSALAGLGITTLAIRSCAGLNLAPIASLPKLALLIIGNVDRLHVPDLSLAQGLRSLAIINDDPELDGQPVKQIIEAIQWSRLINLRELVVRIGGLYEALPIRTDLAFLGRLPALARLDMYRGVRHDGADPSPLEPPFAGLSKHLTSIRIDGDEPERTRRALCVYLGVDPEDPEAGVIVCERHADTATRRPWSIQGPIDGRWTAYGSLLRAERGAYDDTEYAACQRAEQRLRKANPGLLRRLDLDPESAGTGVVAHSPEDLTAALDVLGLIGRPT